MANASFSETMIISGYSFAGSGSTTMSMTGASNNTTGGTVFDTDSNNTVGAADMYPYPAAGNAYVGYTVTINGNEYAMFTYEHLPGSLFVPHNGELQESDFSDGMAAEEVSEATVANCFAGHTMIATPEGARRVDSLEPGDQVMTADGRAEPVLWVGRQSLRAVQGLENRGDLVRIAAGALGDGLPNADLTVTGDHAMVLDGMLVNAAALVNGRDIRLLPASERQAAVTVYHVETERQEVLLANGAPTESFSDVAGRRSYDNFDAYLSLYGVERIVPELAMPRIASARLMPASLRDRLDIEPDAIAV